MESDLMAARRTFAAESLELLQGMESALLNLEEDPEDQDAINSIFRSAHTIKGSSGIVGIETVEKFTHKVESLLDMVRNAKLKINTDIIELLLKCHDHIGGLIDAELSGEEVGSPELKIVEESLLERLRGFLGEEKPADIVPNQVDAPSSPDEEDKGKSVINECYHISLRFGKDVMRNGMDPISFISYLLRLGQVVSLTTIFDSMPNAEEMNPESCYLGMEMDFKSDFDKKTINDVFEFVQDDCKITILPPCSKINDYISLIQSLPEDTLKIGEMLVKGGSLTAEELTEGIRLQNDEPEEKKTPLGKIFIDEKMVHPEVVKAAAEKQKKTHEIKIAESKTLRVDAEKIDGLVNLVGELVISRANINQHANRIKDKELLESFSGLSRIVNEVRNITMKVRMIPIGETFSRFKRVVRDISNDTGKEIDLVISGGESELDKTIVEKIVDPLTHLVRNAVDHGIEMPDERIAKGKPAKGTVWLNAFHDAGNIVVEVSDDGKGLNKDKILKKAAEKGLVSTGKTPTDTEILNFIFAPGFSTADKVTKLSGRGVGLDVVKTHVKKLGGSIDVDFKEGMGTKFLLRMPLTVAIVQIFLMREAGHIYGIPLSYVDETIRVKLSDLEFINGQSIYMLRHHPVPIIGLRDALQIKSAREDTETISIIVVRLFQKKIGLIVDDLMGKVETVIKPLGKYIDDLPEQVEGITGAAIHGTGDIVLILDIPTLFKTAS